MASLTVSTIKYFISSFGIIILILVGYWLYFLSNSLNRRQQNMEKRERETDLMHSDNNHNIQQIVFIRHGQAIHNVNWRALNEKDAKLTETGIKEVKNLRQMILNEFPTYFKDVELIIVSPLKRTFKTMLVLLQDEFESYKHKILLQPLASERGNKLCDIGVGLHDLSLEHPQIKALKSWNELMESNQEWWIYPESVDQFEERMIKFKAWIQSRPEKSIVIVSHSGVIQSLTSKHVGNAEMSIVTWEH